MRFEVPNVVPGTPQGEGENAGPAPASGPEGTVLARAPHGPSNAELTAATIAWLKANCPEALDSKVEAEFRKRGYGIVWTPP